MPTLFFDYLLRSLGENNAVKLLTYSAAGVVLCSTAHRTQQRHFGQFLARSSPIIYTSLFTNMVERKDKSEETTTHQARITKFTYHHDEKQIKHSFLIFIHIFFFIECWQFVCCSNGSLRCYVQPAWKKWILSFNIYGNWAGKAERPRLSISTRENVWGEYVHGKCPAPKRKYNLQSMTLHWINCKYIKVNLPSRPTALKMHLPYIHSTAPHHLHQLE